MFRRSWVPLLLGSFLAFGVADTGFAKPRVVLIGVDGATWNVIDPLIAEGELPNLAALMARGAHAELSVVEPVNSPTVWTAIAAGQPPDVTGIASFILDERDMRVPRMFEWLSHQGLRVGLYQYLVTWPPRPLPNGFVIPGWLAGGPETAPEDLAGVFRYDIAGLRQPKAFFDVSFQELARKPAAWNALLERFDLDAGAVSFYALDNLSHRFWAHSFPEGFDAETVALLEPEFGQALQRAYAAFDRGLGEMLAALPEETSVIVVSDHGFEAHDSPQRRWSFFLESRLRAAVPLDAAYVVESEFTFPIIRVLEGDFDQRELALGRVEAFYESITTLDGDALFWAQPMDVTERPAGHERSFVERGKQFALAMIGRFIGSKLDDEAHGFMVAVALPAWDEVWPDGEVLIGGERVPAKEIVYGDGFTGTHHETAIFVAAGPDIPARAERATLSALDIAPLYTWLARAAVPEGLAGRLPVELLDATVLQARPLETVPAGQWPRLPVALPDAEDADLHERLKAMGYAN